MKKKLVLGLLVMQCLLLGACGTEQESPVTITPNESVEEATEEEEIEEEPEEENIVEEIKDVVSSAPKKMFSSQATIEETTMVDQNDVKIIANSIEYTDSRATLHITIENNSDQDLSFYSDTLGYSMNTINGYVVSGGYLNSDVSAGMKAKEDVYFDKRALLMNGIYDIAEIGMSFYANDSESDEVFSTDLITIKTSIYDQYDFSEDTIKKAINDGIWENELSAKITYANTDFECSQEGITISSIVIADTYNDSPTILVELENTSDQRKKFGSSNLMFNGIGVCRSRWSSYNIPAHMRALADFDVDALIDEEYRSLLSKDEIGKFSFDLSELDFDTYDEISSSNVSVVFDEKMADVEVSGTPIYDAGGIKMYLLPVTVSDYDTEYFVPIYIENNCGAEISVSADDDSFSMDGYMVDCTSFSEYIRDGSNAVLRIDIYKDKAEEVDINSLDDFVSASCKFEIRNYDTYKDIDNPTIELQFK